MHFFFGEKKQQKKITNELATQIKSSLRPQFCEYCNKVPSTKIAFVPNLKAGFTCNNCQRQAVGGDFKNLGEKTLITNDKFAQVLTKSLISYQSNHLQPPQQIKQIQNQGKLVLKSANDIIQKIKIQCGAIKLSADQKIVRLIKQSYQQNSVFVFDQLARICKQKKVNIEEMKNVLLKRALVNKQKGLHFIDQDNINESNMKIAERLNNLKGQTKIKLKEVNELAKWISQIQI